MSDDTPTVTERQAKRREVMAMRKGYVERAVEGSNSEDVGYWGRRAEEEAKARYPLPTKPVPREWTDWLGDRYRAVDGALQVQHVTATTWRAVDDPIAMRVRALADLLEHPTREVEDTGDDT